MEGSESTGSLNIKTTKRRPATESSPLLPMGTRSFHKLIQSVSGIESTDDVGNSTPGSKYDLLREIDNSNPNERRRLGKFGGVFAPVVVTMFSTLLFLRMGFIAGNAGVLEGLFQFTMAYIILILTVLSICAVSTNGAIECGGIYFMISRTLGCEFGGSVGAHAYLANIFASALSDIACVEGITYLFPPGNLPTGTWWQFLYGSCINMVNLIVCLTGAKIFSYATIVAFLVVVTVFSTIPITFLARPEDIEVLIPETNTFVNETYGLYTGISMKTLKSNTWSDYKLDYTNGENASFSAVFGVLFSGVTGVMAGANLSGELRDPGSTIAVGTLSALAFTYGVYVVLLVLSAATFTRFTLHNNYLYLMSVGPLNFFVPLGSIVATFSAALSNLLGSSQLLYAMALDDIFDPLLKPLLRLVKSGNPIGSVIVSFILVELVLLIGNLNKIAQITSVLYLLSYLSINCACLLLEWASAPNFRPTFTYFNVWTASLGAIGTFLMMFVVDVVWTLLALLFCLVLVILLYIRQNPKNWGSISQALIFHQVRKYLLLLDPRKDHIKFWRPQMLLMIANPRSSAPLIDFVNSLKKSGLYVLGHVKVSQDIIVEDDLEINHWQTLKDNMKIKAFPEVTVARSVREGLHHLIRLSGIGAMKPNTILFGFLDEAPPYDFFGSGDSPYYPCNFTKSPDDTQPYPLRETPAQRSLDSKQYVSMISDIIVMKKNVCLCRNFHALEMSSLIKSKKSCYIDVWPINFANPTKDDLGDNTSNFMLQLAAILKMVPPWKKRSTVRVWLVTCSDVEAAKRSEERLRRVLQLLRVCATISTVVWDPQLMDKSANEIPPDYVKSVNEMIKQNSKNTAVSFLYLPEPPKPEEDQLKSQYMQYLTCLTDSLPPTVLVHGISTVTSLTL